MRRFDSEYDSSTDRPYNQRGLLFTIMKHALIPGSDSVLSWRRDVKYQAERLQDKTLVAQNFSRSEQNLV